MTDQLAHKRTHLYTEVTRAAWLGLCVNAALGLTKLIAGWITGSFALIADAVNSIGDVVTTIVVLFALKVAQLPPDDEHPYGHSRAEGIAATNVSLLVLVSALLVGWEAAQRLFVVHDVPPAWTLWIAGANVAIKECLYRYKVAVGRRTGSIAIIANAWDHRSDAMCAAAVLLGLSAIRIGGQRFIWADEIASLVVVAAIIYSSVGLLRRSGSELMDVQADPEFVRQIEMAARRVPGVEQIETLWVRKSGLEFFVDVHIEVNAKLTVEEGHRIGHAVKDRVLNEFPAVRDVLVHLEPHPHLHV